MNAHIITSTMNTCICMYLHVFGGLDWAYRQGKFDQELRRENSQSPMVDIKFYMVMNTTPHVLFQDLWIWPHMTKLIQNFLLFFWRARWGKSGEFPLLQAGWMNTF